MKHWIFITLIFFVAATVLRAAETTSVTAIVKGKHVDMSAGLRTRVVEKAVDLLASCGYVDANPRWGALAEPESMEQAEKGSCLHLVLSSPRTIEVPAEKITLHAHEMVISLPLNTAGIWVRTDNAVMYFAKFRYTVANDLEKLLEKAQNP